MEKVLATITGSVLAVALLWNMRSKLDGKEKRKLVKGLKELPKDVKAYKRLPAIKNQEETFFNKVINNHCNICIVKG